MSLIYTLTLQYIRNSIPTQHWSPTYAWFHLEIKKKVEHNCLEALFPSQVDVGRLVDSGMAWKRAPKVFNKLDGCLNHFGSLGDPLVLGGYIDLYIFIYITKVLQYIKPFKNKISWVKFSPIQLHGEKI